MKPAPLHHSIFRCLRSFARSRFGALTWIFLACLSPLQAEEILFFGNSFTFAHDIPKMVETIAASKGKAANTLAVTKGGQGWDYHLKQPETDTALKDKSWSWVILQNQSLTATHARKVESFLHDGGAFYERIAQESPASHILLYETWSYAAGHDEYAAKESRPATFTGPEEMYGEIHKNYAALQALLQAKDSNRRVLVAPVGTAFALCVRQHPEINIYSEDLRHPSSFGSYLSALVIYATLFNDSPLGAAPVEKHDPRIAKILQEIAAEAVRAQHVTK